MAFYGERFRRPDEEDIWEELAKMISNPPSEAELMQKKKEEQAWIDSILEQAFPEEAKPQKEPYLTYEELMDGIDDKTLHGQPTGMAVPVQKGYVTNVKPTPYEDIDAKLDWSEDFKAQKKSEVKAIQEAARVREKEINREHLLEQAKNYGGAALELGSLAIPGMLQRKVATQAIKMGKPLAEQIVKKTVKRGTVEGSLSGAIEGLGRGIREDENPLKTTAQGAAIGGVTGTALGKVAGEAVAKSPKIKELDEVLDKRKDWGVAFRKQSGQPKEAIEKLLEQKQGFVPKATSKEGVGDIDFVWGKQDYETGQGYGFEHIIDGRTRKNKIDGEEFMRTLPETFEKGVVTKGNKLHPNRIYIEDPKNKISLEPTWKGKSRNWMLTAFKQNKADSKRLSSFVPGSDITPKEGSYSTSRLTSANNIISPSQANLNPTTFGTQQNKQIPTLESEEEWLKRLRRQRQRRGFF